METGSDRPKQAWQKAVEATTSQSINR